jgi:hypothetical protein
MKKGDFAGYFHLSVGSNAGSNLNDPTKSVFFQNKPILANVSENIHEGTRSSVLSFPGSEPLLESFARGAYSFCYKIVCDFERVN